MKAIVLCMTLLFSGCAALQYAPSLKYCEEVSYSRKGRSIHVEADCFEAVESALPLPVVKP